MLLYVRYRIRYAYTTLSDYTYDIVRQYWKYMPYAISTHDIVRTRHNVLYWRAIKCSCRFTASYVRCRTSLIRFSHGRYSMCNMQYDIRCRTSDLRHWTSCFLTNDIVLGVQHRRWQEYRWRVRRALQNSFLNSSPDRLIAKESGGQQRSWGKKRESIWNLGAQNEILTFRRMPSSSSVLDSDR